MSPFFVTVLSVNITMQDIRYDFIDKKGNYDLLDKYVKNKSLRRIIDIGAWWGPWTLWWCNRAENVEVFEPNADILPKLQHNLKKLPHCTLHQTALGNTSCKVNMEYENHTGTYHIKNTEGNISCKKLDDYEFENVDIIKIDVEGYEIPVLQGATQTILKNKPWIQIEANNSGERYGRTKRDILTFLDKLGMNRVYKRWPDQIWNFDN